MAQPLDVDGAMKSAERPFTRAESDFFTPSTSVSVLTRTQRSTLPAMSGASEYSAVEPLRDGRRVEIRALKPDDREGLVAAVGRASDQSLYRRFFGAKRDFSEREIAFFLNVDFVNHVALVAVLEEDGRPVIIAGGRYVVVQPGKAEVAFAVVDRYQGRVSARPCCAISPRLPGQPGLRS